MHPNIHLFGIQGSGKDTQAALLAQEFGLYHISSGAILRARSEKDDEQGREIKHLLEEGSLVSTETLISVVSDVLRSDIVSKGIVGAGMLRTMEEYLWFTEHWSEFSLDEPFVIELQLDEATAMQRALARRRSDDIAEAITKRFAAFHYETEPVIAEFRGSSRYAAIDASQSVEAIAAQIHTILKPYVTH